MKLSKFVRQRRKELGLTQFEVANRAGFSVHVVRRFEANRPYNPLIQQVLRLYHALEVDCKQVQEYE